MVKYESIVIWNEIEKEDLPKYERRFNTSLGTLFFIYIIEGVNLCHYVKVFQG